MNRIRWQLDPRGCIRAWGPGAAAFFRLPAEQVLGKPCAEVVRGTDGFGRPLCGRCPVLREIKYGAYQASTALSCGGKRLRCQGFAHGDIHIELKPESQRDSSEVLASLSWAVRKLTDEPERFFQTLQVFLAGLRKNLGMEAAELFLADAKLNVSPAYLRPGGPYGGSCLPKDLQAMLTFARETALELPLLTAVRSSNERHLDFLVERIVAAVPPPGPILVVGLSFKTGTDDLRHSPNLALVDRLLQKGYDLDVIDPDLDPERLLGANFAIAVEHREVLLRRLTSDLESATRRAKLVVIGKTVPGLVARLPAGLPVVDVPRLRFP